MPLFNCKNSFQLNNCQVIITSYKKNAQEMFQAKVKKVWLEKAAWKNSRQLAQISKYAAEIFLLDPSRGRHDGRLLSH